MANKTKKERLCVDCGCSFWAYPPSKRCDSCAQVQYRESLASRRKGTGIVTTRKNVCAICGTTYESTTRTKYCALCAVMRQKEYHRGNSMRYYRIRVANGFKRVCAKCGTPFLASNSSRKLCDSCFVARRKKKPREKRSRCFRPDEYIYARNRANGEIVYKASIKLDGKQVHLGYFRTMDEARQARIDAYNANHKEDHHD